MPAKARREFRVISEVPLGHGDSRVNRTETRIESEEAARELASWWLARPENVWVETREVTDWQEIYEADRERRGC